MGSIGMSDFDPNGASFRPAAKQEPVFRGKRIAVCMDGTWQRLRTRHPTNIAKIARAVEHEDDAGCKQIVVYARGVGAASDLHDSPDGALAGGLFGAGLENDILDTYVRLCLNYQWGDAIYLFGYSRGAFSVRSLAGLIRRCGIVRRRYVDRAPEAFDLYRKKRREPSHPDFLAFRAATNKRPEGCAPGEAPAPIPISYIGIFDTVGQRGLPSGLGPLTDLFNRRFEFHSTELGDNIAAARHAVAIDERRFAFPPTLWTNLEMLNRPFVELGVPTDQLPYQQRWFPGSHGDVGGGAPNARLPDIPLAWISEGAMQAGLSIDVSEGTPLGAAARAELLDPTAPFAQKKTWGLRTRKLPLARRAAPDQAVALLHQAAAERAIRLGARYRPPTLRSLRVPLRQLRAACAMSALLLAAASRTGQPADAGAALAPLEA